MTYGADRHDDCQLLLSMLKGRHPALWGAGMICLLRVVAFIVGAVTDGIFSIEIVFSIPVIFSFRIIFRAQIIFTVYVFIDIGAGCAPGWPRGGRGESLLGNKYLLRLVECLRQSTFTLHPEMLAI